MRTDPKWPARVEAALASAEKRFEGKAVIRASATPRPRKKPSPRPPKPQPKPYRRLTHAETALAFEEWAAFFLDRDRWKNADEPFAFA